jgi:fatty acid amide hydrolase
VSDELWKLSAAELSAHLSSGAVSSREVVDAHLAHIADADSKIHAFTTVFEARAREDADRLDRERKTGTIRGPFHGVPISMKECFDIEAMATTLGIPSWRDRVVHRDAALVTLLREMGAVILGRTNLSQTMVFSESSNPIYGRTNNPFSLAHTPGGSSGGEAAAIASGMSPFGFGTDFGGSIRSPAHFSGVVGYKPTLDRLPTRGQRTAMVGQEVIRSTGGPMARTVEDIAMFFRAVPVRRMTELDARVAPLAWEDVTLERVKKLRVGVYTNDGLVRVSPAIQRAVERACDVLRTLGCDVVSFAMNDVANIVGDHLAAVSSDGAQTLRHSVGDERDLDPVLKPLWTLARMPNAARRVVLGAAKLAGQTNTAHMLRALGEKSVAELWRITDRLRSARLKLLDRLETERVDVLVCPAFATPALPHGMSKNFSLAASTALIWNTFQFPAGVVPVTTVRRSETVREPSPDLVEQHAAKIDAQSTGLPVGVQVVGRPWDDATVLAVMAAIEAGVHGDEGFPHTPVF